MIKTMTKTGVFVLQLGGMGWLGWAMQRSLDNHAFSYGVLLTVDVHDNLSAENIFQVREQF